MDNPPSPAPGSRESNGDRVELDLRHLRCPLPVLRTRKALARMTSGDSLRVLSTDPLAGLDIPHLVQSTGDVLLDHRTNGDVQIFEIRKR